MRSTLRHARRTRCVALFKTVHAERKEQKELLAKATRTWQGYRRLREGAHWLHQRQEEAAAERHSQCGRVSWRHVRVLVGAFRSNALPWIATLPAALCNNCSSSSSSSITNNNKCSCRHRCGFVAAGARRGVAKHPECEPAHAVAANAVSARHDAVAQRGAERAAERAACDDAGDVSSSGRARSVFDSTTSDQCAETALWNVLSTTMTMTVTLSTRKSSSSSNRWRAFVQLWLIRRRWHACYPRCNRDDVQ